MKWKWCEDCYINGHCENQERSHECNVYAKRVTDELDKVKQQLATVEQQYAKAKWWLNEIVTNHRFTPISTAEMALKDLEKTELNK